MSEDTSCGYGKDVNLFQKGQIIGMHQGKKTSEEIAETTKIGKKMLQFAREHKYWTLEQWKKVMWSDESRVMGASG